MRELDECTAEVFRRSEQRIRERRRNRNWVFAVCLPVCLIAAVWSVISFSPMIPALETNDLAQAAEELNGAAEGSPACPYLAVEIQGAEEHDRKVADRLAVAEMFDAVNSFFADIDSNGEEVGEDFWDRGNFPAEEDPAANDLTDAASNRTDCTIIFTAEDGSQAVYHLLENSLVDVNAQETVFLSDAQAAELLAVLGLSE